jgi:putative nucleotidyltransferase with HDIG domain
MTITQETHTSEHYTMESTLQRDREEMQPPVDTRETAISMAEILRIPAIGEMLRTTRDITSLSLVLYSAEGALEYSCLKGKQKALTLLFNDKDFITSCSRAAERLSPAKAGDVAFLGLHFLAIPIMFKENMLSLLLCGPYRGGEGFDEPALAVSLACSHEELQAFCASLKTPRSEELSKGRKLIKTSASLITRFLMEKMRTNQYVSRMSSLYKISNLISSLNDKKVLRLVLDSAIALLSAGAGSIMLLDEREQELRILVAHGLSEEIIRTARVKVGAGISGGVAQTGKPRLLLKGVRESTSAAGKERKEIDSAICVPLMTGRQVIGVINISKKRDGGNFSPGDVELLKIMASSAAVAINNAHLYSTLKQQAQELNTLYRIGTTITSSMERKVVINEVLKSAQRLLKAKKGSLMLLDQETKELHIESAYGLSRKIQKIARLKLGEGIAGKAALEGTPRLLLKGKKVSDSKSDEAEKEFPSAMSVPVKIKEKVIGVLNVSDREDGENFTWESVNLLSMLASQAAIAIENSRLMEELQELFVQSITALANAIDARDPYTRGHSQRVTEYSLIIARKMGLPREDRELIQYAALLHDIGKIHIRDDILHKPGRLTDDEFEEMQKHPAYGAKIMEPVKRFRSILPFMYHHHEKFAGLGYPFHLQGADIPLAARIISVADSFDAMTSDRPYRKGLPVEQAVSELVKCCGSQFDPEVVDVFIKLLEEKKSTFVERLIKKTT